MKTIGLLGGMTWESTTTYYQVINREINKALGGYHSAKIVMYSVDFDEIEQMQRSGRWEETGAILNEAALKLEKAGADFIVMCTNTMHKVAGSIQKGLNIPFIHIADVTADELAAQGINTVALLGTRYTMEQDFYKQKLIDRGIKVIVPDENGREWMTNTIFNELAFGQVKAESKAKLLKLMEQLAAQGAQGVIFGCTEIGMLASQDETPVKIFDTTILHAKRAVQLVLK